MNYSFVLQIKENFEDLLDNRGNKRFTQSFTDYNLLEELTSFAKLENEDKVRFIVVDLKEFNDVRVIQGLHDGHFHKKFFSFLFA